MACHVSRNDNECCLLKEKATQIRNFRRLPPLYQTNQTIITVFFTASIIAFLVIYLEVSRLLLPDKALSVRDLRHLSQGFANDIPWSHRRVPPRLPYSRHKPSAIVIGFNDCGADHLLDLMALHPDVFVVKRDLHFFESNRTQQWYLNQMPLTLQHHVTVDASLSYITNPEALRSIKDFERTIRIIIVICDPVTRLLLHTLSTFLGNSRPKSRDDNIESSLRQKANKTYTSYNYNMSDRTLSDSKLHPTTNRMDFTTYSARKEGAHVNKTKRSVYFGSDVPKNEQNTTKIMEKIMMYLKTYVSYDSKRNIHYNTKVLDQNGEFLVHLSKAFELFDRRYVHVVNMEKIYSNSDTTEWLRLLHFLQVKTKEFPVKAFRANDDTSNSTEIFENIFKHRNAYSMLRCRDKQFFQKLSDFYTPVNNKLSSYLNI